MKLFLTFLSHPEAKEEPKTLKECILEDLAKTKTELEIAFTAETLTAPTVNLIFDFTIKGRCTNALVKATYYAGSHTETYYED